MSPLFLLVRLRVLEIFRQRSTGFFFLGLPVLFLLLVGVIFAPRYLGGDEAPMTPGADRRDVYAK